MDKEEDYEYGPVEQLRIAFWHPLAALFGAAAGGWVPIATYFEAHMELLAAATPTPKKLVVAPLVAGGLLYSAKKVWKWWRSSFQDQTFVSATGFVMLLEGVMVFGGVDLLARSALGILVTINAVAAGCSLALRDERDKQRKQKARTTPASVALAPTSALPSGEQSRPLAAESALAVSGPSSLGAPADNPTSDELYARAVEHVLREGICSTSALQRGLGVGYPKAAKLVEHMERAGVVSQPTARSGGRREVLVRPDRGALLRDQSA